MEPTLHEGDVLLVGWGMPVCLGQLAVVALPDSAGGPRGLAVKRVTGRDPGDPTRWWVERDNPHEGVDSWLVGSLAAVDVRAAVLARLPLWLARLARLAWMARRPATGPPFGPGRLG